jgi:hypothetical protein
MIILKNKCDGHKYSPKPFLYPPSPFIFICNAQKAAQADLNSSTFLSLGQRKDRMHTCPIRDAKQFLN